EKRRYKRFNTQGRVVLKPEDGTARSISADLVDINFLGLGVNAQEKIEPEVSVKSELAHRFLNQPVVAQGKIKHTQEIKKPDSSIFRMGIEFISIDQKAMKNFINRIQSDISAQLKKRR
ncbi:MAG: PilZ domain-containing protein, partial [Candidatus Omnitrophota bacterium]